MKSVFSVLFVVMMLILVLFPSAALSSSDLPYYENSVYWPDGTLYIIGGNDDDVIIPVKMSCDTQKYHAGEPILFSADIIGGKPPFHVSWNISESQVEIVYSPLYLYCDQYDAWDKLNTSYTTNDRHVEFTFTPPVNSSDLYAQISITDANGMENWSIEDVVGVNSPVARWKLDYSGFVMYEDYLSWHDVEYYENGLPIRFALYDMDMNGIPELIVYNGADFMAGATAYVYTHRGYDVIYVGSVGRRECNLCYYPNSPYTGLFCTDGNNGEYYTSYYTLRNGQIVEEDSPSSLGEMKGLHMYTLAEIKSMGWWNNFLNTAIYPVYVAPDPPVQRVPGDANEDGEIDIIDAMMVLRYDSGWNVNINLSNSDVNGDGAVDIIDAMMILRYDSGWNVILQ